MRDVVLATLAAAEVMGQQAYELALAAHLPGAAGGLAIGTVRVRSLRSTLPGEARLPLAAVARWPVPVQHRIARLAYGRAGLVHRADLRLPAAAREVVTVHDLAPLRFPDEGAPPRVAALHRAAAVVCPSRFAADEIAALLGVHDAVVIPNGLDPAVWTADRAGDVPPGRFVLHSGGATRRKNLAGLAGAWVALAPRVPDVDLVLCGPPDPRRDAAFAGLPRVRRLGLVDRPTHLALMSAADVVVVPSTYEGFGFPALEAMARGTAVVAAARASLPEVCGDAALLVEPDAGALAAGLERVLTDDALRVRLAAAGPSHARGFTWSRSAAAHAAVYRAALS